jgi:hypothetical protein
VRTRIYTEDLASLERAVAAHQPQSHPVAEPHHRVEASIGGDAL